MADYIVASCMDGSSSLPPLTNCFLLCAEQTCSLSQPWCCLLRTAKGTAKGTSKYYHVTSFKLAGAAILQCGGTSKFERRDVMITNLLIITNLLKYWSNVRVMATG